MDLLGNDFDADGDPLEILSINTAGTLGMVSENGHRTVTYSPPPGFSGSDSFSYSVADILGASATGLVTVTVVPKPSIHGQKFNDQNANGIRDEAELGLDGWTIELLDAMTGRVLASGVTRSIDLDGNGVVDPVTERGLYMFDQLNPGTYQVREVLQPLWRQTFPFGRTMPMDLVGTDAPSNGHSFKPAASSDGRFVAFESLADNLVTGDTNSASDIFVYDRLAGVVERINVSSTGREADAGSFDPAISADGQVIATTLVTFLSTTGELAPRRGSPSTWFSVTKPTTTVLLRP